MGNPFPEGGQVFPLPGQAGQALPDITKNYVSVYAEAARVPKSSGLFSSDASLGLSFKIDANYLTGTSALGTTASSITVTKAYAFDVTRDSAGNVILPLHSLAVVDTCPLMTTAPSNQAFLSDLQVNLTFLATTKSTGFSIALQEIFKLSSKLPIPNPFTQYVSILGEGISDVVQTIQSQDSNPQPLSTIGFQFVGQGASESGYYVLLMSTNEPISAGFVDLNSLNPDQLALNSVSQLTYNGVPCQNAYVIFRVEYTVDPLPAAPPAPAPAPSPTPVAATPPHPKPGGGEILLASLGLKSNLLRGLKS